MSDPQTTPPGVVGALATPGDLLALVRSGRVDTRRDLGRVTGLSRTAVRARVNALVDAGLLAVGEELASTGGRPPGRLVFRADAAAVAAVAVGRSRTQVSLADLALTELVSVAHDHPDGAGPDELMREVAEMLAGLVDRVDVPVIGVGVSLPGTVDAVRGVSIDSPVLPGWDGVELAPYLSGVADAPLFLGNDAEVLARSERAGGHAFDDALVLKASTGLGLGLIADGRVLSGHLGAAGEIGHIPVAAAQGLPCRCGRTGCVEAVAAGWALVARLAERGRPVAHVRDLVALALQGDAEARGLLRESGRRLGEVLADAVTLLNPQAVVVGGDLSPAFDVFVAGLRESVYARATALATRDLQFVPATYGDRAGVVGCAALALDHVLSPSAVDAHLAGLARAGA